VIPAGTSGKRKALFQALFIGALLLLYPLRLVADARGWSGPLWSFWSWFHGVWVGVTLIVAIVLTVYSMLDYLWSYRSVVGIRG
jgi:phosphatidylglycerophosphate synthase